MVTLKPACAHYHSFTSSWLCSSADIYIYTATHGHKAYIVTLEHKAFTVTLELELILWLFTTKLILWLFNTKLILWLFTIKVILIPKTFFFTGAYQIVSKSIDVAGFFSYLCLQETIFSATYGEYHGGRRHRWHTIYGQHGWWLRLISLARLLVSIHYHLCYLWLSYWNHTTDSGCWIVYFSPDLVLSVWRRSRSRLVSSCYGSDPVSHRPLSPFYFPKQKTYTLKDIGMWMN